MGDARSKAPSPRYTSGLRYRLLVAIDGFGPIHLDHLDGEYVGETNRAMVAEGLLEWGPHAGYRATDAGRAAIGRPPHDGRLCWKVTGIDRDPLAKEWNGR